MSVPLVSIIIPNYNRAKLISQTLSSVQEQTYPYWECIVVDDHSTDHSTEVIREFIGLDSRFTLFEQVKNKGACACRNKGIELARGDFLIFLDSDDLLKSNCLERRLAFVRQQPNLDFWVFSTILFEQKPDDLNVLLNTITEEDPIMRFLSMDIIWLATGPLWKKQTIESLGGWDESLLSWQDWDLSLRALISGKRFAYSKEADNYWRSPRKGSMGKQSTSLKHLKSHFYLIRKIRRILDEHQQLNPERKELIASLQFWLSQQFREKGENFWMLKTLTYNYISLLNAFKYIIFSLFLSVKKLRGYTRKLLQKLGEPSEFYFSSKTFKALKIKQNV